MDDPIILNKIVDINYETTIPFIKIKTEFLPENRKNPYAICYLVQNKKFEEKFGFPREKYINRIDMFIDSMNNLQKNFSSKNVDIHIFHEGDLNLTQSKQILSYSKNDCQIYMHQITFDIPDHIDIQKVYDRIKDAPFYNIKEYRTIGYRNMCSFYSFYVYPIFIKWGYKKLMRLDDDSFILEQLDEKIFEMNIDYIYRLEQIENENYMLYFKEFIQQFCLKTKNKFIFDSTIIFNNFFIVDLKVYQDQNVIKFLNAVYHSGGIYYCRWGDALIQSYIFKLFPEKFTTQKIKFAYEKWGFLYTKENFILPETNGTNNSGTISLLLSLCIVILIILLLIIWIHTIV